MTTSYSNSSPSASMFSLTPPTQPTALPSTSTSSTTSPHPPSKRLRVSLPPLPKDFGEYVQRDVELIQKLGWAKFIRQRHPCSDINHITFQHPAARLLKNYQQRGVPVRLKSSPWTPQQISHALVRGPHQSCRTFIDFLEGEFIDMILKGQWVVLLYEVAKNSTGAAPPMDLRPFLLRSQPRHT